MKLWEKHENNEKLKCLLCPHSCLISPGGRGICGVRENCDGEVSPVTYGIISGFALDPIEKKPLYHFYPGSSILSVGSYGCNLKCDFCQNFHISQEVHPDSSRYLSPEELVRLALKAAGNSGLAYTYNEPVIWFEYVNDCASLAAAEGLHNVMVTNGYVNADPLAELIKVIDAFNIDLKAFSNEFYRRYAGATLGPVLEAIKIVASSGRHLEITTLIIPGLNDSEDEIRREAEWIALNAGRSVPLHLSRYFPMYRRSSPPTPAETILRLKEIANEYLDFVYTGNLPGTDSGSDTLCPSCHSVIVSRAGYNTTLTGLSDDGRCTSCNEEIMRWV
ncbi:MAG: AmmeMemoRadiSam system radical SAM enzyme [Bacteroidales bacterium]|nr:AmmeMemoRadiSam system radical SAM enzyme [Bacteroidales bacterium]